MDGIETEATGSTDANRVDRDTLRLRDYIWRPWYAKIWWLAIPLYWAPAGLPGFDWFEPIYLSSVGVFLNVVMTPLVAFLILGFRYFQRRLSMAEWQWRANPTHIGRRRRDGAHWSIDPLDPRSSLWIGRHKKP